MATVRRFVVSTDDARPNGPWNTEVFEVTDDDTSALRAFFASHFPTRRIVEVIAQRQVVMAPIAFIIEAEIKDESDLPNERALLLLKTVLNAACLKLPYLSESIQSDLGFRASYHWDAALKSFALHVVCPNTYRLSSELYSSVRGIHLASPPLNTASKGFVLQDPVLGFTRCVPLYMGPSYMLLQSNGDNYEITTSRPQASGLLAIPQPMSGGHTAVSYRSFGQTPVWSVPMAHTVEFFIRMIRSKSSEYDDICCDVAYTECSTASEDIMMRIVGRNPRVGMKSRRIRFLYWIAKRVAAEEFKNWIFEQCSIIAHQFSNDVVTDELFHRLFLLNVEGNFLSIPEGNDPNAPAVLYYFDNIWKIDRGMGRLNAEISRIVTRFIGQDLKDYMTKNNQLDNYKIMTSEIIRLNYMSTLRNQTVKAVARMLSEEIFFDEDPNLVGCPNVVIELGPTSAWAREGRPEDLLSMSTQQYFRKPSDEEKAEVKMLFRKLFGNEETREWFFRLTCSHLSGKNPERAFYVLFGCARNGKSQFLNLLEHVLGDYFGRFSSKALNERKDPSSASPELATMFGKRTMASSELKAGEEMQADILKALTGDDSIVVRALYKSPRVMRMMARIMIATNHFPVFINADKALRDRADLIPMKSVFDRHGAPSCEFEQFRTGHYPAIDNFHTVIHRLAPVLLYMMVEGFAHYRTIGLSPKPKEVVDLCAAYWHEVGVQSRFIEDCLEFVDAIVPGIVPPITIIDEKHSQVTSGNLLPVPEDQPTRPKLTYNAAYDRFVAWAISRQMDISKYPRFTFKSLMDSELASMREHKIEFSVDGWIGCRIKS